MYLSVIACNTLVYSDRSVIVLLKIWLVNTFRNSCILSCILNKLKIFVSISNALNAPQPDVFLPGGGGL